MPNEIKKAEKLVETNPDSALHILHQIYPSQKLSDADRALYGIVLFKALTIKDQTLQPDSTITFSINYYQQTKDKRHLAEAYYFKARMLKKAQQFDDATNLYIKALDLIQNMQYYNLLGDIYSDMADICSLQKDYPKSLAKYKESIKCYKKAGDTLKASYKTIDIARMYRFMKDYKNAKKYYKQLFSEKCDSLLNGMVYQEIGINYFFAKQYDSARYFLNKSLSFPYKGTNYAIRCYNLADLYFEINRYDSALQYAKEALKYPNTFIIQRECYRILTNTEYSRGNFKKMAIYMSKYQDCSDSVHKIENQTKITVLEELHKRDGTTSKFESYILTIILISVIIIAFGILFFFRMKRMNKTQEVELDIANETIIKNQTLLRENLTLKIEETKADKNNIFKKLSISEKDRVIIDIYNQCLKLKYWDEFSSLMNLTFNNLIIQLETNYSNLNHKEITWICLFLLDVPLTDMALILNSQTGSIYKLKQRIARKMNLSSTKELELTLQSLPKKN